MVRADLLNIRPETDGEVIVEEEMVWIPVSVRVQVGLVGIGPRLSLVVQRLAWLEAVEGVLQTAMAARGERILADPGPVHEGIERLRWVADFDGVCSKTKGRPG